MVTAFAHGMKLARRSGTFGVSVVLLLALAIAISVAAFTLVRAVFAPAVPYDNPDRLVVAWASSAKAGAKTGFVAYPLFDYWRRSARSFEQMTSFLVSDLTLTAPAGSELVQAANVDEQFFDVAGVRPAMGRPLSRPWDQASPNEVVLSERLWRSLGRDPAIVGKTVTLDRHSYVVVGVMPSGFDVPSEATGVWRHLQRTESMTTARSVAWASVIGRLAPQRSVAEARTELDVLLRQLASSTAEFRDLVSKVETVTDHRMGATKQSVALVFGAVLTIMLTGCLNVAVLLVLRAEGRRGDHAIRLMLGSSRSSLALQALGEAAGYAAGGALVSVPLAFLISGLAGRIARSNLQGVGGVAFDRAGWGFLAVLVVMVALLLGFLPALHASRTRLSAERLPAVRGSRVQMALIVIECACAAVLCIGAHALLRTVGNLEAIDVGFDGRSVAVASVRLPPADYRDKSRLQTANRAVIESVAALPGVEAAGATQLVFHNEYSIPSRVAAEDDSMAPRHSGPEATVDPVSDQYFSALNVPLLRGRWFSSLDGPGGPRVALVNQRLASTLWPGRDPIGRKIRLGAAKPNPEWLTVVGVVGDMRRRSLHQPSQCEVFVPLSQRPALGFTLVTRTRLPLSTLAAMLRKAVSKVDAQAVVWDEAELERAFGTEIPQRRGQRTLLVSLAIAALLLSGIGLYALVNRTVLMRNHENAVRLALGARTSDVLLLTTGGAIACATCGVILGCLAATVLSSVLASFLYGVSSQDVRGLALTAGVMLAVAVASAAIPAWRAAHMNPATTLREAGRS